MALYGDRLSYLGVALGASADADPIFLLRRADTIVDMDCRPKRRVGRRYESVSADCDDGVGKSLRSFLRNVMTDALEDSVRVSARELLGVGRSVRSRTVEITSYGDRGHGDNRSSEEPLLESVVLRLALR